jgi:hypothetical protein
MKRIARDLGRLEFTMDRMVSSDDKKEREEMLEAVHGVFDDIGDQLDALMATGKKEVKEAAKVVSEAQSPPKRKVTREKKSTRLTIWAKHFSIINKRPGYREIDWGSLGPGASGPAALMRFFLKREMKQYEALARELAGSGKTVEAGQLDDFDVPRIMKDIKHKKVSLEKVLKRAERQKRKEAGVKRVRDRGGEDTDPDATEAEGDDDEEEVRAAKIRSKRGRRG